MASTGTPAGCTHPPTIHANVALAAMGIASRPEAEALDWLRETGVLTDPAPLLDLLQEVPARPLYEGGARAAGPHGAHPARAGGRPWLSAVLASGLQRLPKRARVRLRAFCTSADRLAWAKANGCSWEVPHWPPPPHPGTGRITLLPRCWGRAPGCSARGIRLQWAREIGCAWNANAAYAAEVGHLAVLQWAREHGCRWDEDMCAAAARDGHLETWQWALAIGCVWDKRSCACLPMTTPRLWHGCGSNRGRVHWYTVMSKQSGNTRRRHPDPAAVTGPI